MRAGSGAARADPVISAAWNLFIFLLAVPRVSLESRCCPRLHSDLSPPGAHIPRLSKDLGMSLWPQSPRETCCWQGVLCVPTRAPHACPPPSTGCSFTCRIKLGPLPRPDGAPAHLPSLSRPLPFIPSHSHLLFLH